MTEKFHVKKENTVPPLSLGDFSVSQRILLPASLPRLEEGCLVSGLGSLVDWHSIYDTSV